jgi:acetyltransferase-like isoleucine patch superfamily enzyme
MSIKLTAELIEKLRNLGVSSLHHPGAVLPDDTVFEAPCSFKWMGIEHSFSMGAFSYGVSGYYFASRIGRYCSFGEQVQVGRHAHPMNWASTSPFFYQNYQNVLNQELPLGISLNPNRDYICNGPPVTVKLTVIGNDVWIGHGAFILPGVHIGDGAVIAAMAVVTKNVPPYAIVAGSPAKAVRCRFPAEQVAALLNSKWWEFAPWQLKGACLDDIPDFIEFIRKLRAENVSPYTPDLIKLALV